MFIDNIHMEVCEIFVHNAFCIDNTILFDNSVTTVTPIMNTDCDPHH